MGSTRTPSTTARSTKRTIRAMTTDSMALSSLQSPSLAEDESTLILVPETHCRKENPLLDLGTLETCPQVLLRPANSDALCGAVGGPCPNRAVRLDNMGSSPHACLTFQAKNRPCLARYNA